MGMEKQRNTGRMEIVRTKDLVYEYIRRDEEGNVEGITRAVDQVDMDIRQGEFIAILGHNGSGKSTLAKHINAILNPTEGTVWVDGMDTSEAEKVWDIRRTAGMVSGRWWRKMWVLGLRIWEFPRRKSGNGWRRA